MIRILLGSLAVLMLLGALFAADAAVCGPRDEIAGILDRRYGEASTGIGVVDEGRVLELWRNVEKGTWSIMVTTSRGSSCLIASGNDWEEIALPLGDEGT